MDILCTFTTLFVLLCLLSFFFIGTMFSFRSSNHLFHDPSTVSATSQRLGYQIVLSLMGRAGEKCRLICNPVCIFFIRKASYTFLRSYDIQESKKLCFQFFCSSSMYYADFAGLLEIKYIKYSTVVLRDVLDKGYSILVHELTGSKKQNCR